MKISPIVSPDGRALFTAGGKHSFATHEMNGFVVSLEWVGHGKKAQACMVIWPNSLMTVRGEAAGMWAITRRCIGEFVGFNANDKCTGDASVHCWREAMEALPILGKDRQDKEALKKLVDVVVRFAPDLVMMPSTPRSVIKETAIPAMWEVTQTNKSSGRVMSEVAV
jgi:hypothetical protein